jgi:hypothetical protein
MVGRSDFESKVKYAGIALGFECCFWLGDFLFICIAFYLSDVPVGVGFY